MKRYGHALARLQVDQQVQDRRLHGHVQRRGGLVADDDLRLAGKRTGDGDALLQAAGELGGPQRQVPLLHPHRGDQLAQARLQRVAREAAQPLQRPPEQLADAVAAVEGRVGVLEHDLERFQLLAAAVARIADHRHALQVDLGAGIGGRQAEQHPGEGRLAAARLAHQPQGLAGIDVEIDVDQPAQVLAEEVERLGHTPQAHHRLAGLARTCRTCLSSAASRGRSGACSWW